MKERTIESRSKNTKEIPTVTLNFNDIIKEAYNQKQIENILPKNTPNKSRSNFNLNPFRSLPNNQPLQDTNYSSRNHNMGEIKTMSNMNDVSMTIVQQSVVKKQTECKPFRLSKSNCRSKRPPQQRRRYCPPVHKPFKANPIPEYKFAYNNSFSVPFMIFRSNNTLTEFKEFNLTEDTFHRQTKTDNQ